MSMTDGLARCAMSSFTAKLNSVDVSGESWPESLLFGSRAKIPKELATLCGMPRLALAAPPAKGREGSCPSAKGDNKDDDVGTEGKLGLA